MPKDRVVRTTTRQKPGFLEKLGSNFAGSFAGFALFLLSFYVLYSNESRSVETVAVLEEVLDLATPIHSAQDIGRTDGQLVHVSGPLDARLLGDPKYPVALPCVKLSRHVEMFQWVEHSEVKEYEERNQIKKETTYTYGTEWSHIVHKSRDFAEEFGHENPKEMPVSNYHQTASEVSVNGLKLSKTAIGKINWSTDLLSLPEPLETMDIELHEKYYYHARDPYSPDVGDARVFFTYVGIAGETKVGLRDEVTVIAKNSNGRLVTHYIRSTGVEILHRGSKSPKEVIESEKSSNAALTWGSRFLGWVMMYLGLSIMTKIIKTLVGWIPVLGTIISASVTMFNITLSLSLALTTIAIGWLRARPLLSGTIAVMSVVPWIISRMRAQSMVVLKNR
uniref:transmembrane protein 43-like n=1 Tax=Styela clava TaxID=7725 RepID=UPI00193AC208|nr:transmembrane protein 43-like [Styela clava]